MKNKLMNVSTRIIRAQINLHVAGCQELHEDLIAKGRDPTKQQRKYLTCFDGMTKLFVPPPLARADARSAQIDVCILHPRLHRMYH